MTYWEKADYSWSSDSERYILTPTPRSRRLFYYIQEIGHFKAHQPYFTEREHLPSYLIKFTLQGEGLLRYKNQSYSIKSGDLFFIDCNEYQYYQTVSEDYWEMDWVHFSGAQSALFYEEFIKNDCPVFHTEGTPKTNAIHLILEQLLALQTQPHAQTDYHSSILLHQLLNEALLQKYQQDFSYEAIPKHILDMRVFLDAHFAETLSLEDLETIFHINKYQLNKEFSKFIGLPPIKYQINKKISYSKDLLRYSEKSIKEISLEVGLENFAYFSRLFKKRTGLTPSQYRKIG
ncbi:AraC family transcriptional regulator [Enterococcus sp. AZ194]|uniref:helix-turn-helix domain-containing protein n=1 Tax=Enterococcus sp. AZ194 TaxID=2774629 RepID=UPI003F2623D1